MRLQEVAAPATSRSTAQCASTLVSDLGGESSAAVQGTPNGSRIAAVVTGRRADEQMIGGTDSSEGVGGRANLMHDNSPEKTNDTHGRTATGRPVSDSAAAALTTEGETAVLPGVSASASVAWEMLRAALRTLEVVGQMGAGVVRKASDEPARQVCASLNMPRWCLRGLPVGIISFTRGCAVSMI